MEVEGPPAQLPTNASAASKAAVRPMPPGRYASPLLTLLLQLDGRMALPRALHTDAVKEAHDPFFSIYYFAAFLVMCIGALVLLVCPELVLYHVVSRGIVRGCTPSGEPFRGLRSALGDPSRTWPPGGVAAPLQICPELVVPEDSYCTLLVPVRPLRLGPFSVTSTDGTVLLRALPHAEVPDQAGHPDVPGIFPGKAFRRLLTLTTKEGGCLIHCGEANTTMPYGQPYEFQLSTEHGEASACLAFGQAQNQYVLSLDGGATAFFQGSDDFSVITVTNWLGRCIATAKMCKCAFDRSGDYCSMRIEPGVDAGLVLCSILCINHVGDHSL